MGGGSVGRARIDLDVDTTKAEQKLSKFGASLRGKIEGTIGRTQAAIEKAAAATGKFAAEQQKLTTSVQGSAQAINKLKSELAVLERAFKGVKLAPGSKESNEINRVKDAIENLGGATDRNLGFIQRHSVAINQLAFSAARAGHGFANFLPLIARSSTLLANSAGAAGGASGAMGALRGAASGAAGALGGISLAAVGAIAAVAALIAVFGFLTLKLGPLGSALTKAQNSIKLIFEESGQKILDFSRTASTAFGITEQAALRFVGKTGQLFKSFGVGAESAGEMSEALLVTADVLRSTSTEFIASEEALQAVFDTVAGNVEGLRRFDIFLSEIGLTQVALRNGLKQTSGAFDNVQRSLVSQIAAMELARDRFQQYVNTMDSTQRTSERTKAAFADIKATIGQALAPALSYMSNILLGIVVVFKNIVNSIGNFIKRNAGLINALKKIAELAIKMTPGLGLLAQVLGFLNRKGKEAAEGALSFDDALAELNEGLEEAKQKFNEYKKILTADQLEQLRDAHINYSRAVTDAARAEAKAELTLARVREDKIRKVEDAQRKLFRTIRDGNRAIDKARDDVDEAELTRKRAIRDAEEKLAETRLDSNKKVANAERALAKAREDRLKAILNAQLSLEEALAAGDVLAERRARLALAEAASKRTLKDSQRSLAEAEADRLKDIAKAERALAETRIDQDKKVADARKKLLETIEKTAEAIADAQRELHETEIETNRDLYDARQALLDQQIQSERNIGDAKKSLDDLNHAYGTQNDTLADILDKLEKIRNTIISTPKLDLLKDVGNASDKIDVFQHGGHIRRGQPGIVGEVGPELFIPNQSGTIVSNVELLRALRTLTKSQNGGGASIVVQEAVNGEATAAAVAARLAASLNN